MAELSFAERMRTCHVSRWQVVRTARQQTLAEHLYLVRVITMEFCDLLGLGPEDSQIAEQWALEHDVPEVRTGDLATPVKAAMREAVPHDDPIRRIELSYSDSYAILYGTIKAHYPHVRAMVKMADTLEAVMFLDIEGMGVHAKVVKQELWSSLKEQIFKASSEFPNLEWAKIYAMARAHTGA